MIFCKLRRCGPTNRIVDNSDSKQSEFNRRFWSDSKSNDEIVSYHTDLFLIKFNLILIKFDLILI